MILGALLCARGKTLTQMEGFDADVWDPVKEEKYQASNPIKGPEELKF